VRASAVRVAALRWVALAAIAALGCERAPAPRSPRGGPAAAAEAAPPAQPERRGDRHARAAAREAPRLREISGTVVRADGRRLAIRSGAGAELTLRVGPGTAVTVGGRRAPPAALRPGDDVRASYRTTEGGPATALSVEVTPRPPPPPPPVPAASPPAVEGTDHG
jgi:hypothetical protein